ncbi:hypothetical protein RF11_16209 [Thelohanellus kitauei]|uniref:Uncharacterized protein n=1 Tax=Thelohanellus kitauei TaxID=669202 RepID=A0A0C2M679_THEKT|nr:hypothetical protein RF11_16209 [Thelohanellus kitauei]
MTSINLKICHDSSIFTHRIKIKYIPEIYEEAHCLKRIHRTDKLCKKECPYSLKYLSNCTITTRGLRAALSLRVFETYTSTHLTSMDSRVSRLRTSYHAYPELAQRQQRAARSLLKSQRCMYCYFSTERGSNVVRAMVFQDMPSKPRAWNLLSIVIAQWLRTKQPGVIDCATADNTSTVQRSQELFPQILHYIHIYANACTYILRRFLR